MCGLTGFWYFDNQKENNNSAARQMLALQKHRGPDDSGIVAFNTSARTWEEVPCGHDADFHTPADLVFGFNRLSILDLSPNGHQPMGSPDRQVVLMLNGEVYNAFDFKEELEKKGHLFKSTTDTEIVLHLYLEYGLDGMIRKLNGMFALAIFDQRIDRLFLVRDRFGIKPLYYVIDKDRLAFSSEMKSFKALPGFRFELDEEKLDEFLLFRNVINETLFKNIKNCTPGTYLSVCPDGEVTEHVWYHVNEEQTVIHDEDEAVSHLEESMKKGVERQMISDVKLGCQLSGGVDSSLVTWYAAGSLEKNKLETISIIFRNQRFSEENYVDHVAEKLSLIAHKYPLDAGYYFETMEKATWHFEQPLNHPNTIGIYLLSQQAKKHVTVLLSGEGADESLAGYDRFLHAQAFSWASRATLGKLKQHISNLPEFLRHYSDPDKRMILGSAFSGIPQIKMLKSNFNLDRVLDNRLRILKNLTGEPVLKHRKYELLTFLPDLLMRQDKMSMAHSIENRVPFLDHELATTSLGIAGKWLVSPVNDSMEGKAALKKLCADKFHPEFAYRPKMGFGIPLKEFMQSEKFQQKWDADIAESLGDRRLFDLDNVNRWVKNLDRATPSHLDVIWLMAGFEMWAKQYLDKS